MMPCCLRSTVVVAATLAAILLAVQARSVRLEEEWESCSSISSEAGEGCAARRGQGLLQRSSSAISLVVAPEALDAESAKRIAESSNGTSTSDGSSASVLAHVEGQVKAWQDSRDAAHQKGGPLGIESWIREHLLPQSEKTKSQMQTELDAAEKNVKACSIILRAAEKAIATQQRTLFSVEAKHHECKQAEDARHEKEEELCGDLKSFSTDLIPPSKLKSLGDDNTTAEVEEVVRRNYDFFNEWYPKFMEKRHACNVATADEQKAHAICQAEKREILEDFCALKKDSHNACARYHTCYEKQAKHFRLAHGLVRNLETFVKKSYKTLSCYDKKLSNVDGSDVSDPCATEEKTSHLDITYVEQPEKESCMKSQHTSWNYTFFTCDEDADHKIEGDRLAAHAKYAADKAASEEEDAADAGGNAAAGGNATDDAADSGDDAGDESGNGTAAAASGDEDAAANDGGNGTAAASFWGSGLVDASEDADDGEDEDESDAREAKNSKRKGDVEDDDSADEEE